VKLHQTIVEHLRLLASFEAMVFPWPQGHTALSDQLVRVQQKAGIDLPCARRHEHTPSCRVSSWHDWRRAFATQNAARLTPEALQALMRHRSYQTTQIYINIARQVDEAVGLLHVPDVLKKGKSANA